MKKMLIYIFGLLALSLPIFGQVNDEIDVNSRQIPYDVENIAFALDGTPTPEEVGFDNPKSYWKFTYELRFLDDGNKVFELQKKISAKHKGEPEKAYSTSRRYKLLNRGVKKASVSVTKGRIKQRSLISVKNRELLIPVKLTPQIQQSIADSAGSDRNPTFIVYVKGKLSTRTTSGLKFKGKYANRFSCPVKIRSVDAKLYWSLNRCGVSVEALIEDNKIRFGLFSRL